jgi:hypothetical protein
MAEDRFSWAPGDVEFAPAAQSGDDPQDALAELSEVVQAALEMAKAMPEAAAAAELLTQALSAIEDAEEESASFAVSGPTKRDAVTAAAVRAKRARLAPPDPDA